MDPFARRAFLAYFGDWPELKEEGASMVAGQPAGAGDVDPNVDRYRNIYDLLSDLSESGQLPNEPVERVEITCLANGEANCRYWTARAEEPEGLFLPDPLLG